MVYAAGSPPAQPAGFSTDTLVGALREMSEGEVAGRLAPQAAELVRRASVSLGDRVEERTRLITHLLREPGWEVRYDALRPAKVLIEGWRGSYDELVFLLGGQLLDPHPRLPAVAASALEYLDVLAAPAADALARSLDATPRESPHTQRDGLSGWVTTSPQRPPAVGRVLRIAELGPAAASTAPALQRLLDAADVAWLRVAAAGALWRTTGDVSRTLPALTAAWSENPYTRTDVANYLAEMGEAAATAAPLLLAELERRRRHTAREHGWSSDQVSADLALLRACNRALAATAPQ
jgi:hypothetical protein